MNATERAAILRGIYNAVGTFAVSLLTALSITDDLHESSIIAGISALGVLGFRAGVEGLYDGSRQRKGDVTPADVNSGPVLRA